MGIQSYYDFSKLFSYNATMNGVCGGRGLGKTFGSKKKATSDALKVATFTEKDVVTTKRGIEYDGKVIEADTVTNQFIYLRRYKEELALARATFFADYEHLYPDWDFRLHGWEAQASPHKYADMAKGRPWATIGYFVALSVAQNFKSVQFPNVKTIIYDEFIAEEGVQYLPNEAAKFMNFYNTVDRYKDKTRVLMLANSVAINNPYFIQYKVDPDKTDDNGFIRMSRNPNTGVHYMLWHFPDEEQFKAEVYGTQFGRFIADTDPAYAAYAVGNKFSDNNKNLIERKSSDARYIFTLEFSTGTYGIWYDLRDNRYYCEDRRPRADEDIVVIDPKRMAEGKRLMTFSDKPLQMLRTAYRQDRVRFHPTPARNAFMEIFKR